MTRISEFVIDVNDQSIREAIVNIGRYTSAAGQMKKNIEQVEAQLKLLESQGKANTKEYVRQIATLGRYSAEQELNTAALKANLATVKAHSKETLGSKGTYAHMKMQVQELTKAMEKLDLTTKDGSNMFIQYREQLQKIKGDMALFEEAIGSTSAEGDMLSVRFGAAFNNLGGYVQEAGNSFKELKDAVALIGIDGLTEAMGGAASAVDNANKAYSGFQAVLKLGNSIIGAYKTITTSITAAKEAYRAGVSAATIVQQTVTFANTINGLSKRISTLLQAQQDLDLSTEEGRQAYAKYAIEIEQVNQELEKQQTLAENLSLAAEPVSMKPVDGTEGAKDPFAGMEKVEIPDDKDDKADKVEGIIIKAQKAADAFGKMNEALDLAEQISDARLQNELARIDEKRQAEIDAVNASVLSEEEKKRRIEDVNKRYDKQAEEKKKAAAKREKAFAITKTIIAGAQAVAQGIAQFGPPPSPAGIAAIAAAAVTTATQLALIAKQKFAKGGYIPFEDGGTIQGASHALGGVPFLSGGTIMEAEGGELIVNRNIWSRPDFVKSISEMNALTGGKRFFASGGVVPSPPPAFVNSPIAAEAFDNEALIRGLRGVIAEEVGSLRVVNNVVDTTSQQRRLVNIQANASF